MTEVEIIYPNIKYKNYIEQVYKYCEENKFSMILKGSLAKGVATKFSDIDLMILGDITEQKLREMIAFYDNPVMINYTENPKGILILIYQDNICIDMDIRDTVSCEDLEDTIILLKYENNFMVSTEEIKRKEVLLNEVISKPDWYKIIRLVHRGLIKYLSNKTDSAYILLSQIKEKLKELEIYNLDFTNEFKDDIKCIFYAICSKYKVDSEIKILMSKLFQEFNK